MKVTRDLDKEKQVIRNGDRYTVNPNNSTGVFSRDIDRLYKQYANLRLAVWQKHRTKLYHHIGPWSLPGSYKTDYAADIVAQDELMDYIDEQFIKLVKEYKINGAIDFPGYIKDKLERRVRGTYLKREFRDKDRERLSNRPDYLSNVAEPIDDGTNYEDLIREMFYSARFSKFDQFCINQLTTNNISDNQLFNLVKKQSYWSTMTEAKFKRKINHTRQLSANYVNNR